MFSYVQNSYLFLPEIRHSKGLYVFKRLAALIMFYIKYAQLYLCSDRGKNATNFQI